jgi:hypothetical protein
VEEQAPPKARGDVVFAAPPDVAPPRGREPRAVESPPSEAPNLSHERFGASGVERHQPGRRRSRGPGWGVGCGPGCGGIGSGAGSGLGFGTFRRLFRSMPIASLLIAVTRRPMAACAVRGRSTGDSASAANRWFPGCTPTGPCRRTALHIGGSLRSAGARGLTRFPPGGLGPDIPLRGSPPSSAYLLDAGRHGRTRGGMQRNRTGAGCPGRCGGIPLP